MDSSLSVLGLPGEIRNSIFEYVFAEDSYPAPFTDPLWSVVPVSQHWQLQVRLTCRQINQETSSLVFSRTRFVVESWNNTTKYRLRNLPVELASAITSVELAAYFKDTRVAPTERSEGPYVGRNMRDYLKPYVEWIFETIRALPALNSIFIHYGALYLHSIDLQRLTHNYRIWSGQFNPANGPRFYALQVPIVEKTEHKGTLKIKPQVPDLDCDFDEDRDIFIRTKEFVPAHIAKVREAGIRHVDGYPRVKKFKYSDTSRADRQSLHTLREDYLQWVSQIDDHAMAKHLSKNTLPQHVLFR